MGLPIWNNSSFNKLNHKSWIDKGVYITENKEVQCLNELIETYDIQTIYLGYGANKNFYKQIFVRNQVHWKYIHKKVSPVNTFSEYDH